jgi:hypothetical protein
MKVHCCCGYYSDYAEKITGIARPRDPPFWESYMFCWAVKSGQYYRDFHILKSDGRLDITRNNFDRVRLTFGEWAAKIVRTVADHPLYLVPVPNTEALTNVSSYRTLTMVQEAFDIGLPDQKTGRRWLTDGALVHGRLQSSTARTGHGRTGWC